MLLLLQNEVYTGAMVQGRNRVISYKVHRQISVPEAEWFVVRGTHEAIIDRETFGPLTVTPNDRLRLMGEVEWSSKRPNEVEVEGLMLLP